jgi:hypothetical protein
VITEGDAPVAELVGVASNVDQLFGLDPMDTLPELQFGSPRVGPPSLDRPTRPRRVLAIRARLDDETDPGHIDLLLHGNLGTTPGQEGIRWLLIFASLD